ncbi:TerD family protein [Streptomyces sp. NPDC051940]|uniref:TerD family protein n=1 Tax=Streptomyces sp. NPDC051940 TaxID=3155675 RepID=UPI003432D04D
MGRTADLEPSAGDEERLVVAGTGVPTVAAAAPTPPEAPRLLPAGGVVDLPGPSGAAPASAWHVTATWTPPQGPGEVDVVAFVLDEDGQVIFDEDFVFYGAPGNPARTVRLLAGGPGTRTVAVDVGSLPPATHKVVVAAAVDGDATFGDVGVVRAALAPGAGAAPLALAVLDAATTERTLLIAEIYRRGPVWRFRAVGQGYEHGLAVLARGYGVDIAG